jgi:hypothetical protein
MINMSKNSVKYLQDINFSQLTFIEKNEFKNLCCATPERCFSTLKSVEAFLTSTRSQDCLSGLATLSVEKVMTENIINFNDKAIDKSANHKGLAMDFS